MILPSGLGDLGCSHVLGAWGTLGPEGSTVVGIERLGRTGLQTSPTWTGLQPPDAGGSSYSSAKPSAQKDSGPLGHKSSKKYLVSKSPGAAPPAAPSLESPQLGTTVSSASQLWEGLGLSWGYMVREKKYPDISPGVFFLAHSTRTDKPGTQLYLGRLLPK